MVINHLLNGMILQVKEYNVILVVIVSGGDSANKP